GCDGHAPPVTYVRHVARIQRHRDERDSLRQPDQPQRKRLPGQVVDLPADDGPLDHRRQCHANDGQDVAAEVRDAKRGIRVGIRHARILSVAPHPLPLATPWGIVTVELPMPRTRNAKRPLRPWTRWSTKRLLQLRLKDLNLTIEGRWLEDCLDELYSELMALKLVIRPHAWLSDELFSPGGVPGIAIPFYLAHPRLMRLERSQLLEVEGGTHAECMKILRH